jgi:hypothetical protein
MPAVSTITSSNPAARQAAIASPSAAESSLPVPRVASERMKMFGPWIAFIRMRSPSSAPPVLRRVGSTDSTAILSPSPWSRRKRRTSSSVSELLPAPPVPVTPRTGAGFALAFSYRDSFESKTPSSSEVMTCARQRRSPFFSAFGACCAGSKSQRASMSLIIPCRPMRWPSSGEYTRATP